MNNAELYRKSNTLQKRDALDSLEEYAKKIKWKKFGERIVDIGCGDGSVTTDILKEYIPYNYEILVGCDISEKMVHFANENYSDERMNFKVFDLETRLPEDLRGKFDHAFSFYALHWIKQQETAFLNIYDMLADGGGCFLVFVGHHPIFDVYRILAKSNKWSSWLHNVDKFISPYHDSQNSRREISKMMEKIGFRDIDVKCNKKSFVYENAEALKKAVQAVNPFKIPSDLFNDFMEDYLEEVRSMKMMNEVNNNQPASIKFNYYLITVFANK